MFWSKEPMVKPVELRPVTGLPEWAILTDRSSLGRVPLIRVDADAAYKSFLRELKVEKIDCYWLEVVYQCIKLELQLATRTFGLEIHIQDPENKWAQIKFPRGRGAYAATQGREARGHFRRLRGMLPG